MSKTFKPMLAGKVEGEIRFPVMGSSKLDGVRCIVIDGVAMSRSLKPIPNAFVQKQIGKAKYNGLDGELMLGNVGAADVYRKTVSAVMSEDGEPNFTFWIFDNYKVDGGFELRYESLFKFDNSPHIKIVKHTMIRNHEQLDAYEAKQLDAGLEGVMVRDPQGPYKYGRSSTKEGILLKLKRFEDSEAEIIGVQELLKNENEKTTNALGRSERSSHKANMTPMDTMGCLDVRDLKTKVEFSIGTGFDADTRKRFWKQWKKDPKSLLKTIHKYKFFAGGSKDKPRFPVYIGPRDKRDM
jgi:DNA ligase 1